MDTLDRIVAMSSSVRYAALYRRGELRSRQRVGVAAASAAESFANA